MGSECLPLSDYLIFSIFTSCTLCLIFLKSNLLQIRMHGGLSPEFHSFHIINFKTPGSFLPRVLSPTHFNPVFIADPALTTQHQQCFFYLPNNQIISQKGQGLKGCSACNWMPTSDGQEVPQSDMPACSLLGEHNEHSPSKVLWYFLWATQVTLGCCLYQSLFYLRWHMSQPHSRVPGGRNSFYVVYTAAHQFSKYLPEEPGWVKLAPVLLLA